MTTIDDIIESFSLLDDWESRYELLIELGKKLPPMPEAFKTDDYLVKGCVSQVWIVPQIDAGVFTFQADSDAHIVKGLVALLYMIFNKRPANQLRQVDIEGIFTRLDLAQNLSPNRRNGFYAMTEKIRSCGI
ncbi:MAG: SufE family protein [Pseudobdellovibrionaceae bacterium]